MLLFRILLLNSEGNTEYGWKNTSVDRFPHEIIIFHSIRVQIQRTVSITKRTRDSWCLPTSVKLYVGNGVGSADRWLLLSYISIVIGTWNFSSRTTWSSFCKLYLILFFFFLSVEDLQVFLPTEWRRQRFEDRRKHFSLENKHVKVVSHLSLIIWSRFLFKSFLRENAYNKLRH